MDCDNNAQCTFLASSVVCCCGVRVGKGKADDF